MHRKTKLSLLIVLAFGLMAAAWVYLFVYNKKHPNYEQLKPDYSLEATVLFESFRNDQEAASAIYNGKIVAVNGILSAVEMNNDMTIAVFVIEQGMFGDEGIRCSMLPGHAAKLATIEPGTPVTLKGFVTGYNGTDVILEHGSIIN